MVPRPSITAEALCARRRSLICNWLRSKKGTEIGVSPGNTALYRCSPYGEGNAQPFIYPPTNCSKRVIRGHRTEHRVTANTSRPRRNLIGNIIRTKRAITQGTVRHAPRRGSYLKSEEQFFSPMWLASIRRTLRVGSQLSTVMTFSYIAHARLGSADA
jgi:hypothetical protein